MSPPTQMKIDLSKRVFWYITRDRKLPYFYEGKWVYLTEEEVNGYYLHTNPSR